MKKPPSATALCMQTCPRMAIASAASQSGHIILSKYATTGDGILTSIELMEAMLDTEQTAFPFGCAGDGVSAGAQKCACER